MPESAIPCYFQRKLYAETEKLTEEKKSVEVDRNAVTSSSSPPRNEILDKLNAPEIKIKVFNYLVAQCCIYCLASSHFRRVTILSTLN